MLAAVLLIVTQLAWNDEVITDEIVELISAGLVIACIMGRLWSTLYIGGRENDELVTTGPFSMTRNPLYFFSTIGAVGVGLMYVGLAHAYNRDFQNNWSGQTDSKELSAHFSQLGLETGPDLPMPPIWPL